MRISLRSFAVVAVVGLAAFALAPSPAHAQYRRVPVRRVPIAPAYYPPVVPRAPLVAPPTATYPSVNRSVLPGMNVNQLALYSVLSMDPTTARLLNVYRPVYVTPVYPVVPYTTPALPYTSALPYNSANYYNPYFASFGFYP